MTGKALRESRERAYKNQQDAALDKINLDLDIENADKEMSKEIPQTNPVDEAAIKDFRSSEFSGKVNRLKSVHGEKSVLDAFRRKEEKVKEVKIKRIQGPPLNDRDRNTVKFAESGGKNTANNPRSSASGFFQFIDSTWKGLVESDEGKLAGLTMDGRSSERQQVAAFNIHSAKIAEKLREVGAPVNINSVYFGWHFGVGSAGNYGKSIFKGKASDPIPKGLLTAKIKAANPWTRKVKNIGEFREGLNEILQEADQARIKSEGKNKPVKKAPVKQAPVEIGGPR